MRKVTCTMHHAMLCLVIPIFASSALLVYCDYQQGVFVATDICTYVDSIITTIVS